MMLPILTMGRAMTEEEYLARLGLLRLQSGKRKSQEPIPAGSSVLDVPIGGTKRIPDTVLRRPPQPEDTITGLPEPSMAQRHAESVAGYLTPKIGGPRARTIAQTVLGGDESALPFGIGLQELVPFSPYVAEEAGRMVRSGVETGSPLEVGMGLGLGALQASPAAVPLARGAKAVGRRVREAADPEAIRQYVRQTQGLTGLPGTAVVKPKGGNWLEGSVEKSTSKWTEDLEPMNLGEITERHGEQRAQEMLRQYQESPRYRQQNAINKWIDQKLNKYIKNEMGTADDPIRKQVDEWAQAKGELLAQKDEQIDRLQKKMVEARQARGLTPDQEAMLTRSRAELEELRRQRKYIEDQKGLHFDPYNVTNGEEITLDTIPGVVSQRTAYGFPREGLGKDPNARQWEALSDMAISDIRAGTIQNAPNTAAQLAKAEQNYQQVVDSVRDAVSARIRERSPDISERDFSILAKDFNVQKSLRTEEETRLLEDAKSELFKAQNADKPKYKTILEENPWVMGLDPEARLFERPITDELGFDHLVDELKNAMRSDSGLPSRLQLKPEDLSKMTVAKAARLVDEINAYRSGIKADADRAVASNAATVEVKSYDVIPGTDVPNTQGFAWKQIKQPVELPEGFNVQKVGSKYYVEDNKGQGYTLNANSPEEAIKAFYSDKRFNAVEKALKYEGDILSHCVGGYCDEVIAGRSQIFSLRDANGMPAVTIETKPGRPWNQRSGFFYEHPELEQPWVEFSTAVKKQTKEQNLPRDPNYIIGFPKWLSENQPEMYAKYANLFEEPPADIIQIKGKKNGPPAPEHLPFVQDFVRNGNWGSIGDFKNTGFDFPATGPNGIFDADQIKTLEANGVRVPKLLTRDEAKSLQDQLYRIETGKNPETGMAVGGLVQNTDTLRDKLIAAGMDPEQAMQQALRMADQVEMAEGGSVKADKDWRRKLVGGGIRGIVTRGLLGMDPPEDMTPRERDIYENMVRLSAPAQGLGVGKAIFIGAKAKTWNKSAADRFVEMEKAGVSPEQMWRETGTFRGADGKLRQEISDVGASHRNPSQLQELGKAKKEEAKELQLRMVTPIGQKDLFPKALTEAKKPVREQVQKLKSEADELMRHSDVRGQSARFVLEHPALYKAYPELADIPVMQGVSGSGKGSLIGAGPDLQMSVTQQGLRHDPKSTVLHEMQHAVQSLEDMAPGGSPAMAFQNPKAFEILQELRAKASTPMSFEQFVEQYGTNANNAVRYQEYLKGIPQTVAGLERQLQQTAAMEYYKRLAGEAEARATQFREKMGPTQRLQEFPYSSYDVLPEDLIVKPPRGAGMGDGMQAGGLAKAAKAALKKAEPAKPLLKPSTTTGASMPGLSSAGGGVNPFLERARSGGYEVPSGGLTPEDKAGFSPLYHKGLIRVEERNGKKYIVPGKGAWYEFASPQQQKTLQSLETADRLNDLSFRRPTEDLITSAQSSFYDFEIAPGVRLLPIKAFEPFIGGYDTPAETRRIQVLAQAIKQSGEIEPLFVGIHNTGVPHLMEGQHRIRALKSLGYDKIPARVVVDMDEGMQAGGLAKAAKALQKKHPTVFPPIAPLTKQEIRPMAQRISEQMTDLFVRPDPKMSFNPAGKSRKTFEREKNLPVEVTQKIPARPATPINYEELEGGFLVGVPGDPTIGGVAKEGTLSQVHEGAAELKRLGDVEFEHPVQLFGGPQYGAFAPDEHFWASNLGPARGVQNIVTELGQDAPVYGQYIKMSPESTNFALHNLDALLAYMKPEQLGKSKLEKLNREIRKGSPKYGKFPGFQGFEDPVDVLLQAQMNSDLRKHIAETLMKPTVTQELGLRSGSDVLFGITEPSLRNVETGLSGFSIGKMKPGAELTESRHPTYTHDIPGLYLGQSKYPVPVELAFPTSTSYVRSQLKPGVQEFNMLKMVGPRERIDPQYIDQMKMYEELMKEYTGKKDGGIVKPEGADEFAQQVMQKIANQQVSA